MRFSYAESMTDPAYYAGLATAAEDAGYDGFIVPDSICYPQVSDATYPYSPDGRREFLEDKPFLEPFSVIPALAAVTSRIRFDTFVVKLAIRHPVLVAKQASTVAVLSGNRLGLGVGVSPWPEDFRVCGVEWKGRGRRMDEELEIIRGLTGGDYFEYHGQHFDLPAIKICPVPTQPIPLLIGGHADGALRRAARMGDGWMHAGGGDLPALLRRVTELRSEYGRGDDPFEVHVISLDGFSIAGIRRLEDLGVTSVIVGFRWAYQIEPDAEPLRQKIESLRRFADDVIQKVR